MIGQAIGRWGNFFNREAFGSETDVFCKMGLTTSSGTIYVHPTFLYESLWNVIGFIILHIYSKKKRKYDGQIFLMYLAWYGLGRFFIEGLRTDSLYLFGTGIRVSQLLAAVTFVIATVLLIYNSRRHKPEEMFVNVVKARQTTADAEKAETSEKVADEAEAPYENFDKNIKTTEENTLLNKKDSNEEEL